MFYVVDLFAGCGGLSEGFRQAGFSTVADIEMDFWACETLKTRHLFHELRTIKKRRLYNEYVKGEKAATFVAHEDIPRIKENKTGTKNTILANEERLNSISVLPFDLIIVLKIRLPVFIIDLMVKITTGKKNSSFNYNYTRRLI